MRSIFELDEFAPRRDAWQERLRRLNGRKGYYDGSIYKQAFGWLGPRLYRGIKTLYLPLHRAVQVDAGIVPGGWAWRDDAPEAWEAARKQVFAWSRWSTDGVLYVHRGAQYGVSALKVADLRDVERVVISPVDPTKLLLDVPNPYLDPTQSIYVEERGDVQYAEVIDAERVRLFVDARLEREYDNPLGFVPYVEVRHIENGDELGECTYEHSIPLLNEVNELASYLADIIKKNAEPQWAISGADGTDMVKSGDNIWFLPQGATAHPLLANVDIDGVLAFVETVAGNLKESLPELAFDELKSKDQIATATVELQLMELTLKVKRMRPNYDAGLVAALRLAGRAAATMGLSDIALLDDDLLAFDDERPVLPLDPITEATLEAMKRTPQPPQGPQGDRSDRPQGAADDRSDRPQPAQPASPA